MKNSLDDKPPSPILFSELKLSVAAFNCLKVKEPVFKSSPLSSAQTYREIIEMLEHHISMHYAHSLV